MMRPASATPAFLAEHYVYELSMLRATYRLLLRPLPTPVANAVIESFAVHARVLLDFFGGAGKRDDAIAAHFTAAGSFHASATSALPPHIRSRLNKQIAHLTYARTGAVKIGPADRLQLLIALETEHSAFKGSLAPDLAGCLGA